MSITRCRRCEQRLFRRCALRIRRKVIRRIQNDPKNLCRSALQDGGQWKRGETRNGTKLKALCRTEHSKQMRLRESAQNSQRIVACLWLPMWHEAAGNALGHVDEMLQSNQFDVHTHFGVFRVGKNVRERGRSPCDAHFRAAASDEREPPLLHHTHPAAFDGSRGF